MVASLLLVFSECALEKWDENWEDTVAGVPDAKDIALFDKRAGRNGIVSDRPNTKSSLYSICHLAHSLSSLRAKKRDE